MEHLNMMKKTKTLKSLVGNIDVSSINTENEKEMLTFKRSDFFSKRVSIILNLN